MLIYKIASNLLPIDSHIESEGIIVRNIQPARFSFITSMRIATECKRALPDAIFVYNKIDAAAAVSARSLYGNAETVPYPIFLFAGYETPIPKSIGNEIAEKIDGVVFDSEDTKKKWQAVRNISIIETFILPPANTPAPLADDSDTAGTCLLYAGPLDEQTNPGSFFNYLAGHPSAEKISINVLGTGKARHIMPIVKRARANKLNVNWLGDDYNLTDEMVKSQGFILSSPTPCLAEIQLLSCSKPAVTADNYDTWLTPDGRIKMQRQAREIYETKHSPDIYVEKLKNLLHKNQ